MQSPPRIYYPDISSVQFRIANDRLENLPLDNLTSEVGKAGFDLLAEYGRRTRLQELFGNGRGDMMWITGVTDEVVEHALEYSKKDVVRIPPAYELIEGRLFSPRFAAYADTGNITNEYERNGSVLRGLKNVQKKLAESNDDSYVIWTSPDGPLGIENFEYDYSWTHFFWKEKMGDRIIIRYASIRSDFTLIEHADFLNTFLEPDKHIRKELFNSRMQGIQEILETPVKALREHGINNLADIAKAMEASVGRVSGKIYTDKETGQPRFFSEVVSELSTIDFREQSERKAIQNIIDYFESLLYNSKTKEEALMHMAYYVLTLNYYYRTNLTLKEVTYEDISHMVGTIQGGYSQILLDNLQQVKGCAGGMVNQNTSTFTKDIEPFTCPKCGYRTFEKIGNMCPGCGITKEAYARKLKEKGEKVCD